MALIVFKKRKKNQKVLHKVLRHWQLYVILMLPVLFIIVFNYMPMYGVQIAFRNYNPIKGITESDWVGLLHFKNFFNSYQFSRLLKNTLQISIVSIVVGFPIPIILALALNECRSRWFSRSVQMITYAPYFISTVILVSVVVQFLSPYGGFLNTILGIFGIGPYNIMANPNAFLPVYVISGIWQTAGYSAVIYVASLAGVPPELHEAAKIDGANILQKIRYIDLPSIMPTAIILLILNCGRILNVGFEKVFLLQSPLNMETSDVISTYVYRIGIQSAQYSYSTAIGLFNSIVSLILLVTVNRIAKKTSETSLW